MNNNLAIYDSSLHSYRTNFKDWYIDPDYDIDISEMDRSNSRSYNIK